MIIDLDEHRKRAEEALFDDIVDEAEEDDRFVDDFVEAVVFEIVECAYENGFDLTNNPAVIRDVMLMGEAMKGMFRRTKGLYHPTHDISEPMFVFSSDEDELVKFLRHMKENYETMEDEDDDA